MCFICKIDSCPSRKLIRHTIRPSTVLDDDAGRRLLVIVLPFQVLAVAQIVIQDYPFPVTGVCASENNCKGRYRSPVMIVLFIRTPRFCARTRLFMQAIETHPYQNRAFATAPGRKPRKAQAKQTASTEWKTPDRQPRQLPEDAAPPNPRRSPAASG